jgi:hypothetical protein
MKLLLAMAGLAAVNAATPYPKDMQLVEIFADPYDVKDALKNNEPDRDDFEEIFQHRLKLWVNKAQKKDLAAANLTFTPTVDESESVFLAAKIADYHHTKDVEPDWTQYCSYACHLERMADHEENCVLPFEREMIGTSADGREIWAMKIGNSTGPEVGMYANIHGDETTGFQLMERWIWESCNSPTDEQVEIAMTVQAWYLPLTNPDGFERNSRYNGNFVDLNRNYPWPTGQQTGTIQPETRAMMDFVAKHNFVISTMFHGGAQVCNTAWDNCYSGASFVNPDGGRCPPALSAREDEVVASSKAYCDVAMEDGFRCSVGSGCQTNGAQWYQISGSLQDYEFYYHDTLAMTMELTSTKRPSASNFPDYYANRFYRPFYAFMKWAADNF